jgi:sortase (surface protein transpeptidase)
VWSLKGDPEPPRGSLDLAQRDGGSKQVPGLPGLSSAGSSGANGGRGRARDSRPPHSPRVPATLPRLEIPAIRVRAHVEPLGRTASGALAVPTNWSVVGRWRGGSKPGEPGAAILVGHVDSQSRPAIFHHLHELVSGDLIRFVRPDRTVVKFVVVGKRRSPKTRFPTSAVYEETRAPTLRLITCGGDFDWSRGHYKDNLIVYAEQV